MLNDTTINIIFTLVSIQTFIICVFFYEKNPRLEGTKAFMISALGLLGEGAIRIISPDFSSFVWRLAITLFLVATYFFVCKAFVKLLKIRVSETLERIWMSFALFTCIALSNIDALFYSFYVQCVASIAPMFYLLYLLKSKMRLVEFDEEVAFLSYILMLIILVRVVYVGTDLAPLVSPDYLSSLLPFALNEQFRFCCQILLVFAHVALVISFLLFVFRFKEVELKAMGETDSLTGLYNRKAFFEKVANINNKSDAFLIMVDADFFKKINDTYGHVVGDEALRHIAQVMQSCVSNADILARYGGEEFIVAAKGCDADRIKKIAERIRSQVEQTPLQYEKNIIKLTVSVGVARLGNGPVTSGIDAADKLLYQAKSSGRNRVLYGLG